MAGKLLAGAAGAVGLAAGVTRHVLWYVNYQVNGNGTARLDESARKLTQRAG
jgi:hypothetical protein